MAETGNDELIIACYAFSLFSLLLCYYPLLLYYMLLGNLQMILTSFESQKV